MKFAKVILLAALVAPSVAAAQNAPPPVTPVTVLAPIPTNLVFLAPLASLAVLPFVLDSGESSDTTTTTTTN